MCNKFKLSNVQKSALFCLNITLVAIFIMYNVEKTRPFDI